MGFSIQKQENSIKDNGKITWDMEKVKYIFAYKLFIELRHFNNGRWRDYKRLFLEAQTTWVV